ncbi:MAG TPA: hypothetical protein VF278_15005, partial [Pirellulales bacterium]
GLGRPSSGRDAPFSDRYFRLGARLTLLTGPHEVANLASHHFFCIDASRNFAAVRPTIGQSRFGKELAMKWLLVAGALAIACSMGCCQPGGLFNREPVYGSYYPATSYAAPGATYAAPGTTYAAPAAGSYSAAPCTCN